MKSKDFFYLFVNDVSFRVTRRTCEVSVRGSNHGVKQKFEFSSSFCVCVCWVREKGQRKKNA